MVKVADRLAWFLVCDGHRCRVLMLAGGGVCVCAVCMCRVSVCAVCTCRECVACMRVHAVCDWAVWAVWATSALCPAAQPAGPSATVGAPLSASLMSPEAD